MHAPRDARQPPHLRPQGTAPIEGPRSWPRRLPHPFGAHVLLEAPVPNFGSSSVPGMAGMQPAGWGCSALSGPQAWVVCVGGE